jgi:hypothetical protein
MKNLKTFEEFLAESHEFDPAKTNDIDVLLPAIKSASDLKPGNEYTITVDGNTYTDMMYQGLADGNYIFNSEDMEVSMNLKRDQIESAISVDGIQQVNESKFRGKDIFPNWVGQKDFGLPVKSIRDLKPGKEYIIHEPGMDVWQAEYIYQGKTGDSYIFNSSSSLSSCRL